MIGNKYTLMLIPITLFYIVLFVLPVASFLRTSGYANAGYGQLGDGPTLDNYRDVIGDSFYRDALIETLKLSALTSAFGLVIAYPMAYAIARKRSLWSNLLFVGVVSTMFVSAIVLALGWKVLLARSGPINDSLIELGLISEPMRMSDNFTAALIGTIHAQVPLMVIGLVPVCEALRRDLLEAAAGLGASRFRTFWTVIFPLTRSGIVAIGLLAFATTTGAFTTPALLGGGRVGVLSILIRQQTLQLLNYPLGATLAVILMVVVFAIVALTLLATRRSTPAPLGR